MTTEEIKLLDEYACAALSGLLARPSSESTYNDGYYTIPALCYEDAVKDSFVIAKSMLLERQRILNASEEE